MKEVWKAPRLEELDVRMTRSGAVQFYSEGVWNPTDPEAAEPIFTRS